MGKLFIVEEHVISLLIYCLNNNNFQILVELL